VIGNDPDDICARYKPGWHWSGMSKATDLKQNNGKDKSFGQRFVSHEFRYCRGVISVYVDYDDEGGRSNLGVLSEWPIA
jgi:hypothetical protein